MKKDTSKNLLVSALTAAVCCFCGGIVSVNAIAQETSTTTNVFEMVDGASVRTVEPSGIRFITSVPKTVYDSYTQPVCGTLLIPTDVLGTGELTLNTANVLNIETMVWQQFGEEYDTYKYTGVLIGESVADGGTITYTGLPSEYWNVSFSAVGYIYESGDTSNVTYTSTRARSLAQTAALALASGKETGDLTFLKEICDTVIGDGLSFAQTEVSAYAGDRTVDLSALLTGNKGLQAIWTSADETVATVDENGVVTMLKAGEVKITATIGTKTAECTVTISDLGYDEDSQTV
ncbi:MAG: Ig-like domain-containing protein, partial [Candidatus Scatosoma sp.]